MKRFCVPHREIRGAGIATASGMSSGAAPERSPSRIGPSAPGRAWLTLLNILNGRTREMQIEDLRSTGNLR